MTSNARTDPAEASPPRPAPPRPAPDGPETDGPETDGHWPGGSVPGSSQARGCAPGSRWPGAALTGAMAGRDAPGVFGVAVTEDFRLAWSGVTGGPPDRLFQAGSVAKPVTALAALALAARGEIGLDADVNGHLAGVSRRCRPRWPR